MIRGLPSYITEQHIQDNIASHGLAPKDIRLIRKKDTGASRGFAFVEFSSLEDSTRWMEAQQGWLSFDGTRVSMQYSVPRDQRFEIPKVTNDWICAKCGVQNFRRRDACFKCNGQRSEFDKAHELIDEVSSHPTNTVLLRGLDALTTEDSVLAVLGPLTKLPLKSVRIGRDPLTGTSKGMCYVEMNSVVDSMFLHNQLLSNPPIIDQRRPEICYQSVAVMNQKESSGSQNQAGASNALEAAQWTNKSAQSGNNSSDSSIPSEQEIERLAEYSAGLYAKNKEEKANYIEYYKKFYREGGDCTAARAALKESNSSKPGKKGLGKVTVEGVEYQRYHTPDVSKYQYDETSGYYYDPISTLYYDANSQYYFNSKTNKFCYWNAQHETFLPAPDAVDSSKSDGKDDKNPNKGKSAKKIQKEMEKWAKKQNQMKETVQISNTQNKPTQPSNSSNDDGSFKGAEDIAFSMLQRRDAELEAENSGLKGLKGYGSDNDEDKERSKSPGSAAGTSVAEFNLTDWAGLACLLCSRAFQTREKLQKHNGMSDLHKQNLEAWRSQQQQGEDGGDGGGSYRDRAKERRNKFGVDETKPQQNKFKEKYMRVMGEVMGKGGTGAPGEPEKKIGEENVGNKMLQKMGWKDGLGLGKANQGRTEIITQQSRTKLSGLGTKQVAGDPSLDYKDAARRAMWSRYGEDKE